MNGQAFGGFANGLMGGLSLGMAAKNFKAGAPNNKPDMSAPASGSTAAGYSGDLSKFQATPSGSVGAASAAPKPADAGGPWTTLKGVAASVSGLFGGQQSNPMSSGVGAPQVPQGPQVPQVNGMMEGLGQ